MPIQRRWRTKPPQGTPIDRGVLLAQKLAALWPFNEARGTTVSNVASADGVGDGTLVGGVTWVPRAGGNGRCLSFDGTSGYVDCGDLSALDPTTGGLTLAAWVNWTSYTGTGFAIGRDSATGRAYDLGWYDGYLNMTIGGESVTVLNTPPTGQWMHVAGTVDPVLGQVIYLDGQIVATGAVVALTPTISDTNIGRRSYGGYEDYFNGLIDCPLICNQALSPAEIKQLYQNGLWRLFRPRPAYWVMCRTPGVNSVAASASATFTTAGSAHVAHQVAASASATFTTAAAKADVVPVFSVASSDSATFMVDALESRLAVSPASGSATFTAAGLANVARQLSASDSAAFTDAAIASRLYRRAAADSATFATSDVSSRGASSGVVVSATFTATATGRTVSPLGNPILDDQASDCATFSTVASATVQYNLGRYRRGDNIPLQTTFPSVPDYAPVAVVYDSSNNQIAAFAIPTSDPARLTYGMPLFVGLNFSLGSFSVFYHYVIAGVSNLASSSFDVVAGGDSGGSVMSLYSIDRPEARSLVAQLACGRLVFGGNPTVQE